MVIGDNIDKTIMKKILVFSGALFMLFCPLYSYGQKHKKTLYEYRNGANRVIFFRNNTFCQCIHFVDSHHSCVEEITISEGRYHRHKGNYVLNTSSTFFTPIDSLHVHTEYLSSTDSNLYIRLETPYESLFAEEQENPICTYPHEKIYQYSISIVCDSDSINKHFENTFNLEHNADTCGIVVSPLPSGVRVFKIKLLVSWMPEKAKNSAYAVAEMTTQISSFENNYVVLTIPDLTYSYLYHKKYLNEKVMKVGNNEYIIVDGETYKHVIFRSNFRIRIDERRERKRMLREII